MSMIISLFLRVDHDLIKIMKKPIKNKSYFIYFVRTAPKAIQKMNVNTIRKSYEDKLIAGTIATHLDNENKIKILNELQTFLDSISSFPMNENDVVSLIKSCKKHLVTSHSVACDNLSNMNRSAQ